eukprot:6177366-Pleurochrysis_carterae.AAC.2
MSASWRGKSATEAPIATRKAAAMLMPIATTAFAADGCAAPRDSANLMPMADASEPEIVRQIHITRYDALKMARSDLDSVAAMEPT